MFSVAARYTSTHDGDKPPTETAMWPEGDVYLEDAKRLLDSSYSSSRPATCQALLLMGYREIGIGAMAQAWHYVGMAIRMAHDLGLHKNADQWTHGGASLFSPIELQERRRIWYACVIMDKYVSSYIGRPLCIYEQDFDTELPSANEVGASSTSGRKYGSLTAVLSHSLKKWKNGNQWRVTKIFANSLPSPFVPFHVSMPLPRFVCL
jgi:hypothetical protein